jgi:hypothetical protein
MSNDLDKNMISSKEVLARTGISRATLNNYIKLGIIPRPVVKRPGKSFKNVKSLGYFNKTVLEKIDKVKMLKKEGKSMDVISEIIREEEKAGKGQGGTRLRLTEVLRELRSKNELRSQYRQIDLKKKSGKEIYEGELKITFEEMRFPAYLVNFDLRVIWINPEAERKIFHQTVTGIRDEDSRNIFKLIFNWGFHSDVENWKDLLAYHMSFAKLKFTKTWLARLYKGISDKEADILEKVYDETDSNKNNIIKGTNINFLKKDGSMEKYCAYNMFFKEGILFVYVPFDD